MRDRENFFTINDLHSNITVMLNLRKDLKKKKIKISQNTQFQESSSIPSQQRRRISA